MANINLKDKNIKPNGIYETFYKQVPLDLIVNQHDFYDHLEFNEELLLKNCSHNVEDFENEEEFIEEVRSDYIERIHFIPTLYSPACDYDYDEQIAYDCGLIPFKYKDFNLLALGGCGQDLSPRLDAYQALISGTVDRNCNIQSKDKAVLEWYEYILGSKVLDQILNALGIKKTIKISEL